MIRIKAKDEYIKYPRPWIFLAGGCKTNWRDEICEQILEKYDGTILDPVDEGYDVDKNTTWEVLGLWSCDIIVFWFENGTDQPLSLFELGSQAGRYFSSGGKTPPVIIGIDPEYGMKKEVVNQIGVLNSHMQEGIIPFSISYSLKDVVKEIDAEMKEIEGKVQNNPICSICYKTIPCEHVVSFAQVKLLSEMKKKGVDPPKGMA